jgi:hypothetical protein
MMRPIERVDMNQEELDALLERARTGPLSEEDCAKLRGVIETLSYLTDLLEDRKTTIQKLRQILFGATTEKTSNLLKTGTEQAGARTGQAEGDRTPAPGGGQEPKSGDKPKGHGRNGALSYIGATKIKISHESLKPGDGCPKCQKGKVYASVAPRRLVRIVGQAPLGAKVYEMENLRCNLCLEVFTAQAPEGVGDKKYDETSGSMIALLKYGTGFPFYRLEHLQGSVGIPLPASTQWEIVHEVAGIVQPAHRELIRQGAQGEVLHNDDKRKPGGGFGGRAGTNRDLYLGYCLDWRWAKDRALFHGAQTCRRKLVGYPCRAGSGARSSDSDVRCAVAQCAGRV